MQVLAPISRVRGPCRHDQPPFEQSARSLGDGNVCRFARGHCDWRFMVIRNALEGREGIDKYTDFARWHVVENETFSSVNFGAEISKQTYPPLVIVRRRI